MMDTPVLPQKFRLGSKIRRQTFSVIFRTGVSHCVLSVGLGKEMPKRVELSAHDSLSLLDLPQVRL